MARTANNEVRIALSCESQWVFFRLECDHLLTGRQEERLNASACCTEEIDPPRAPAELPAARPRGREPLAPLPNNPLSPRPELLFLICPVFSSWPGRPVR